MDAITLLLLSQLMLLVGVLLSSSQVKGKLGLKSLKSRLRTYFLSMLELSKEDELPDLDTDDTVREETSEQESDDSSAEENAEAFTSKDNVLKLKDKCRGGRRRRSNSNFKQTPNGKIDNPNFNENLPLTAAKGNSFSIKTVLRWVWSVNIAGWASKLNIKKPFKSPIRYNLRPSHGKASNSAAGLCQGKLIESGYLARIIAARKHEKLIRRKIDRLNVCIVKARRVGPMPTIPELLEVAH